MRKLLTVREFSERTSLREGTIRFWMDKGILPKVKLGRAVRIPEEALEKLIRDGYVPARRGFGSEPEVHTPLAASDRSER